jgi:predicted nucleic acid-binding protein
MKRFRVYADTSVFGGCFDDEFADESKRFFAAIKQGKFILVVSSTTLTELQRAPDYARQVLADLPTDAVDVLEFSEEIINLRDAYLAAGILKPENKSDAEHIASASVADSDFVVSWNFRHIVNFEKIAGYQAVNLMNGYKEIRIYSPKEVVESDEG